MIKYKFIIALFVIFGCHNCFAQSLDLGSWNIVNIKFKVSEKVIFFGEGQIRSLKFYDNYHYYEYKGGISYAWFKNFNVALGAGSYQTYKEGGDFVLPKNNDEFRIWPQVTMTQSVGAFKVEQRYRSEFRFTSNGYRNRFRYRLGLSHAFGKKKDDIKPFQLAVSNELFFTNKEPYFERNRSLLSLNYNFSKNTSIQLGYLHQFDYKINDETGADFLVFGFYYELGK